MNNYEGVADARDRLRKKAQNEASFFMLNTMLKDAQEEVRRLRSELDSANARAESAEADAASWADQCSQRVADWDEMRIRAEAAEAALKEAQEQPVIGYISQYEKTCMALGDSSHAVIYRELHPDGDDDGIAVYARPVPAAPADNYRDAYVGAREDLLGWKRRALEAERKLEHVLADTNGPVKFGDPVIPAAPAPYCDCGDVIHAGNVGCCANCMISIIDADLAREREFESKAAAPAVAVPADCDVRKILLEVVPGFDGNGQEIYAKNIGEVESLLSDISLRLDDAENALRNRAVPAVPEVTPALATLAWERAFAEGDDSGVDFSLRVARHVRALLQSATQADKEV